METDLVLLRKDNGIAVATINRPERMNAVNEIVIQRLTEIYQQAREDDSIRVFILTGAGRAFCAGADIKPQGGEHLTDDTNVEVIRRKMLKEQEAVVSLRRIPVPTIAMINGPAVGFGFEMAMACDMRFASERAQMMVGFTRLGLIPPMGEFWYLPRIIGVARAAEFIFTSNFIDAKQAESWGLVNRTVAHQDLENETMAVARKIADGPPIAIRLEKSMLHKGLETSLAAGLDMSAAYQGIAWSSEDFREGLQALREKRKPVFRGK